MTYRNIRNSTLSYIVVRSSKESYRVVLSGTVSYRNDTEYYIVVQSCTVVVKSHTDL